MAKIEQFKGLHNVSDSLRMGFPWLATANNIDITDTGAIQKREGYAAVPTFADAGEASGVYSTMDFQRLYIAINLAIRTFDGTTIHALTSTAPMYWTEVNKQVFFTNGTDSGIILPDNTVLDWDWPDPKAPMVTTAGPAAANTASGTYQFCSTYLMPDGRETGASVASSLELATGQMVAITPTILAGYQTLIYVAPANSTVFQLLGPVTGVTVLGIDPDNLGRELQTAFMDPLPAGATVVQEWKGRIYAAEYVPSAGQTIVWFTEPLGYHLFNLNSGFFLVPGQVHMLAPHKDALIVGTDAKVYAYDVKTMTEIADYGVVPGQHWVLDDDGRIIFWTLRGVCTALPFTNLTEKQVSVAPGLQAGGCLVRSGGQKRYVVSLQQGGSAFNDY